MFIERLSCDLSLGRQKDVGWLKRSQSQAIHYCEPQLLRTGMHLNVEHDRETKSGIYSTLAHYAEAKV